jgi:hypothetical protein
MTTVPKTKLGSRVGCLDDENMVRLNQAMMVFNGRLAQGRKGNKARDDTLTNESAIVCDRAQNMLCAAFRLRLI